MTQDEEDRDEEAGSGVALARPGAQAAAPKNLGGRQVSGRTKALGALDDMLKRPGNLAKLTEALEKELGKDPVKFFREIVMPLLPKEAIARLGVGDRVVTWESLLTTYGGGVSDAAAPFPDAGGGV